MYFWRIVDSLKEDFPSLWELMTEDEFHSLMREYLTRHPSSHWTLRDAGQHLPQFLKKHAILKKWPFLVDLARFEWAMIEAFDAADGTLLQAERLKALPPQDWSSLQLGLIPAHRLLRCRWPIHKARESILAAGSWSGKPETTFLQVWRKGTLPMEQTVFYRPVDGVEFRLLRSLRQGGDFASLCQKLVDQVGEAQAPQRAAGYLQSWLQDKILLDSAQA